ncbi:ATP-grasp domain-containing protein [Actinokineospora sp. NPDC004072]
MSAGDLLVLGAGEEQVVLYQEARRRGLRTIAVDMRADRPGIALADEFLRISTTDHRGIAAALRGRRLAGVVSTAADTCLDSWHHLSVHFGTPWVYPAEAAAVSMDKSAFHRTAAAAGVPTYRWAQSDDLTELAAAAAGFRFPVVVKPTDASGGRGVHGVDDPADLDVALKTAARLSPRGQVIVEEFVEGVNYTVNVFMSGGEVALGVITEKMILPGPGFLIGGHTAPARLTPADEAAMTAEAAALCRAFGLLDGPANFDVVVSPDGTRYVLEVGARMSGNGFPRLVSALAGVDCVAAVVALAIGEPVRLEPTRWRPTRLQVLTSPLPGPGEFVGANGLDAVAALPDVTSVELFVRPGDAVQPFTEAGRKLGWVVVSADDRDGLAQRVDEVVAALDVEVRPAEAVA